jgi:hypothetical protein
VRAIINSEVRSAAAAVARQQDRVRSFQVWRAGYGQGSSHADILKALAFCFELVNTNAHDDPAAARRILGELERMR